MSNIFVKGPSVNKVCMHLVNLPFRIVRSRYQLGIDRDTVCPYIRSGKLNHEDMGY